MANAPSTRFYVIRIRDKYEIREAIDAKAFLSDPAITVMGEHLDNLAQAEARLRLYQLMRLD